MKRYGNNQKLRNELIKNFSFECWTCSASHHYIERKNEREKLRECATHHNILLWINEYIDHLNHMIKIALKREERDEF